MCCAQVWWNVIPSARTFDRDNWDNLYEMIFRWNIRDACTYLLYTIPGLLLDRYLCFYNKEYLYLFTCSPIYCIICLLFIMIIDHSCYSGLLATIWLLYVLYHYLLVCTYAYITVYVIYHYILLERERGRLLSNVIVIAATMTLIRSYHHYDLLLLFFDYLVCKAFCHIVNSP